MLPRLTQYEALTRGEFKKRRIRPEVTVTVVVISLALQVHLPLYFVDLGKFDLPLLVVIYLVSLRKNVTSGLLIGAAMGLAQDSLTQGPIGIFGILKTVVAYLASTVGRFIKVDLAVVRIILTAILFVVHQLLFWIMKSALLGSEISSNLVETIIFTPLHAGVAVLLFQFLDRFHKDP